MHVFHGGKSFEAIGEDFRTLERSAAVINADVLDAWFDPSPRVLNKLERFLPFLVRSSPPVRAAGLVEAIAHARGVPEPWLLAGGGSSDLIFNCLPQLVKARQRATILDPMYGEYRKVYPNLARDMIVAGRRSLTARSRPDSSIIRIAGSLPAPALPRPANSLAPAAGLRLA